MVRDGFFDRHPAQVVADPLHPGGWMLLLGEGWIEGMEYILPNAVDSRKMDGSIAVDAPMAGRPSSLEHDLVVDGLATPATPLRKAATKRRRSPSISKIGAVRTDDGADLCNDVRAQPCAGKEKDLNMEMDHTDEHTSIGLHADRDDAENAGSEEVLEASPRKRGRKRSSSAYLSRIGRADVSQTVSVSEMELVKVTGATPASTRKASARSRSHGIHPLSSPPNPRMSPIKVEHIDAVAREEEDKPGNMSDDPMALVPSRPQPRLDSVAQATPTIRNTAHDQDPPADFRLLLRPEVYAVATAWRAKADHLYRHGRSGASITRSDIENADVGKRWRPLIERARKYAQSEGIPWPPVQNVRRGSSSSARKVTSPRDETSHRSVSPEKSEPAEARRREEKSAWYTPIQAQRERKVINYSVTDTFSLLDAHIMETEADTNAEDGPSRLPFNGVFEGAEGQPQVKLDEIDLTGEMIGSSTRPTVRTKRDVKRANLHLDPDNEAEGPRSSPKRQKAAKLSKPVRPPQPIPVDLTLVGQTEQVQSGRCNSRRWHGYDMCTACVGKVAGDGCRFIGFRIFPIDPATTQVTGPPKWNDHQDAIPEVLEFPDHYNVELSDAYKYRSQECVSLALLPVITREWLHAVLHQSRHKPVQATDRITCDFCSTSVFGGTWLCSLCGREYCLDCKLYFAQPSEEVTSELREHEHTRDAHSVRKKRSGKSFKVPVVHGLDTDAAVRLSRCKVDRYHGQADLLPISRWTRRQVYQGWLDIVKMAKQTGADVSPHLTVIPWSDLSSIGVNEDVVRLEIEAPAEDLLGRAEASQIKERVAALREKLATYRSTSTSIAEVPQPEDPANLATHAFYRTTALTSDNDLFDAMWVDGVPIVVDDLLQKFKLDWSPEGFIARAGDEKCPIVDCQTHMEQVMGVADFFRMYKTSREDRGHAALKLRDWPTTTEFRLQFPDLFEDFSDALPFPEFTRRDGVLNITSHFPANASCPDIGPKMYNAFAGLEGPGDCGSTRLHMDMADAVNVLMHANPRADGSPGCARWDIFRPEDADAIRQFLRNRPEGERFTDPIHSQIFFLDSARRRQLWEETGVYSYRIYQYPGQAVFIPAGCAHQVCNLSDCIKIACDFVSPHNIERCAKLTEEFRGENLLKMRAWKADVLQLKNTMWYAWLSCQGHSERVATYPVRQAAKIAAENERLAQTRTKSTRTAARPKKKGKASSTPQPQDVEMANSPTIDGGSAPPGLTRPESGTPATDHSRLDAEPFLSDDKERGKPEHNSDSDELTPPPIMSSTVKPAELASPPVFPLYHIVASAEQKPASHSSNENAVVNGHNWSAIQPPSFAYPSVAYPPDPNPIGAIMPAHHDPPAEPNGFAHDPKPTPFMGHTSQYTGPPAFGLSAVTWEQSRDGKTGSELPQAMKRPIQAGGWDLTQGQ